MSEEKKHDSQDTIKKLYRSREDKMLAGVCAGIAEYFNIETALVRILWVIFSLFGGIGLFLYIAGVVIIPENPAHLGEEKSRETKNDKALFWGALLIAIGVALLLKQFGFFYYVNFWSFPWQMIWAVFLIIVGLFLLYNRDPFKLFNKTDDESADNEDKGKSRQVYRSRKNKMLAGVCGGLAEYFNLDPTILRLVYVLLTLASVGIGIIAYIIMIIVFPETPELTESTAIERNK